MSGCFCTGRCREIGYCPNNPPWNGGSWPAQIAPGYPSPQYQEIYRRLIQPASAPKPRIRVKAGREVVT